MKHTRLILLLVALGTYGRAQIPYYGGVDLGAKGTKGALFSLQTSLDQLKLEVVDAESINTKLVSSMKDGEYTKEGIEDATKAAKEVLADMEKAAKNSKLEKVEYFI